MEFSEKHKTICDWASSHKACEDEFARLTAATSDTEVCQVLADNWWWCGSNGLTSELLAMFDPSALDGANIQVVANSGSDVWAYSGSKVTADSGSEVVANSGSEVVAKIGSKVWADSGSKVTADSGSDVWAYSGS